MLFAAGLLLLAAAVWTVLRNSDQLAHAWRAAERADWWLVLLVVLSPVVNIALTGLSFSVLTRGRGVVGHGEMVGLIWVASALNQLPLRPGMFGRIAYHRAVNEIPVAKSVRVIVEVFACAVAANGLLLLALLAASAADWSGRTLLVVVAAIITCLAGAAIAMRTRDRRDARSGVRPWRFAAALSIRLCDMCVWAARYAMVFVLIGVPIDARGGAALACAGQAAMMAPVPMGLREWVIGLTSAWLPAEFVDQRALAAGSEAGPDAPVLDRAAPGLLADVVNRSAELAVGVPGALVAGVWLARRRRRVLGDSEVAANNGSPRDL